MKKLIAILLFVCLISPFFVGLRTYELQLKKIKKSIKHKITENINQSLLVRLSFHRTEVTQLEWEHSKEFKYNEFMYDIISEEIKPDSVIYWCWLDYEETQLEKSLKKLVAEASGKNTDNTHSKNLIKNLLQKVFILQDEQSILLSSEYNISYIVLNEFVELDLHIKTFSPPPELN